MSYKPKKPLVGGCGVVLPGEISLTEWDGDDSYTLQELVELLPVLQKKYGKHATIYHATIYFDGGHSNVIAMVHPTKKQKETNR